MKQNVCCCFGQRVIVEDDELKTLLRVLIENLIADEWVEIFLIGGKDRFSELCYDIVASMQQRYSRVTLTRCRETACREMIQSSRFCLVYYDEYTSVADGDETRMILEYAVSLGNTIIQVPWPRKETVL